jgi:hypothetical protein
MGENRKDVYTQLLKNLNDEESLILDESTSNQMNG